MQSEPLEQTSPQLTLRSRLGHGFWLVLAGAILGFFFGTGEIGYNVNVLLTSQTASSSLMKLALAYIGGGMGIIVFSIIGIIAGFGITEEKVLSALLIILAGVGMLTTCLWGFWGTIFPAMFFFIGGALILLKKE